MSFDHTRWTRFPLSSTALYLEPDGPSWFVPTTAGDRILSSPASRHSTPDQEVSRFLQRLPECTSGPYAGRSGLLGNPPPLDELWLHITNTCNMSCNHCLFSSGPDRHDQLSAELLLHHTAVAYQELGCRQFALTGGEPLVHPEFAQLMAGLLTYPEAQVTLLTNGLLLSRKLDPAWPRERIHLQISMDGSRQHHDRIRGTGSFTALEQQLALLREQEWSFTLSMCPTRDNYRDIPWLVDFAADQGAMSVHYMWYFIRGRGGCDQTLPPEELLPMMIAAGERSRDRQVPIDNFQAIQGRLFSPPGTVHDGSSAGVTAAAIGPDNRLYPTAATVGVEELATPLERGLAETWRTSPVLGAIRRTSAKELDTPWRFIHGGGDFDHSYFHGGMFMGDDPYQPLMEGLSLHLIEQAVARLPEYPGPGLCLKMGELLEQCEAHGPVALCQSNCLLHVPGDSRRGVKEFYAEAAGDRRADILNPVAYDLPLMSHIPAEFRFRGYGCGSPILDAELQPGERVVDLGSGTGVECFIAARLVGPTGRATGIDMLEPMLDLARCGAEQVRKTLGYDNLEFLSGYLEELPLPSDSADVLVSNCVLNLSPDKRRVFAEIVRVLRPGGRLVAADVVCETQPSAAILNDESLRGECIAGAMTQKDLVGILAESGFTRFRLIRRLPYRTVQGHPFFSLTFVAEKPSVVVQESPPVSVIYPGPATALELSNGQWITAGVPTHIPQKEAERLGDTLWRIDDFGFVDNIPMSPGAGCALPPESRKHAAPAVTSPTSGCLVCGEPLEYRSEPVTEQCHYCGQEFSATSICQAGHYVCDICHLGNSLERMEHLCLVATSSDPVALFQHLRNHPSFPLHGPQYHALVPGVLLTALRNAGNPVSTEQIQAGIRRGGEVPGGSCGFMGICGAATGIGIAFSVLLEATPLKARQRQLVQQAVQQTLADIAGYEAARCCQRDCWLALRRGVLLAQELLGYTLPPLEPFSCEQMHRNAECAGADCPLCQ